jgi:hypothetical protein
MAGELVCSIHGPYNAALGRCPYCSGEPSRPMAPTPLDEDDMPTNLGEGKRQRISGGWGAGDDDPTDLGVRRRKGFLDDDDEGTELPSRGRFEIDETVLDSPHEGLQAILWVKDGRRRGKIYKIIDGLTIGRKNCELLLDEENISGQHAKMAVQGNDVLILDLLSKNGTFINGEKINAATSLKENDTIRIGHTTFVVKILEP